MVDQKPQLSELMNIYSKAGPEVILSEDQLKIAAFDAYKNWFIPEMAEIFNLVGHKGDESPRFHTYNDSMGASEDYGSMEPAYKLAFMKAKRLGEADRIEISDGKFINVSFKFLDGQVTVEDTNTEVPVVLDSPASLVQPIPSSKRSPAGNALGWIIKMADELSGIKVLISELPDKK